MRQRLSPADRRRAWRWAALIVLMMLAAGAGIYLLATHEWTQTPFLPDESEALRQAARELEFEQAAKLRDEIKKLMGETVTASKSVRPGMVGSAKKSRSRSRK